jgi:hypothetical protein
MEPKQYSRLVGWILLLLGVASVFTDQLFGIIQFDPVQNLFRLGIGLLAIAFSRPERDPLYARSFLYITSPSFIGMGCASFLYPQWGNMHFEAVENLLHVGLGILGCYLIWTGWKKKRTEQHESPSSSSSLKT